MFIVKTFPSFLFAHFGKISDNPQQLSIGLSQVGEFSFVLGSAALVAGAITKVQFTALLLSVIISITFSTMAVRRMSRFSRSI